ncbi:6724_t:CDS:2 [Paraglomus occultum]|uniref:6724_t:CDS:1 n=1 Tax=Paraglomus occultum TaxID=144539 RepID=A0A9N8VR95_9GLOM|nr:6724_t:CDS:2 [Paraglomus occultum]
MTEVLVRSSGADTGGASTGEDFPTTTYTNYNTGDEGDGGSDKFSIWELTDLFIVIGFPVLRVQLLRIVVGLQRHAPYLDLESGNMPPLYGTQPPAPEPVHLYGKKHEATTESFKAGNQEVISGRGGASTYQIVPESSVSERQLAVVSDNGRIVQFNESIGTMVLQVLACVTCYQQTPASSGTGEKDPLPLLVDDLTPDESNELHYFEITVLSNPKPEDTTIAIGLATKPYPPFRLPGWNLYSVGYHSDDGRKFNDAYGGRDYGPEWGEVGDTVGCGYYPNTGFVFFTKNGENIGTAFTGMRYLWYPTVGAHGHVKINFGDDGPFKYCEARGFVPSGRERSSEDMKECWL